MLSVMNRRNSTFREPMLQTILATQSLPGSFSGEVQEISKQKLERFCHELPFFDTKTYRTISRIVYMLEHL